MDFVFFGTTEALVGDVWFKEFGHRAPLSPEQALLAKSGGVLILPADVFDGLFDAKAVKDARQSIRAGITPPRLGEAFDAFFNPAQVQTKEK